MNEVLSGSIDYIVLWCSLLTSKNSTIHSFRTEFRGKMIEFVGSGENFDVVMRMRLVTKQQFMQGFDILNY